MRCPQCTERNSVAARKCEFCGERFKRKPLPLGLKLGIGGVAIALTASIAASFMVPKLVDPGHNLARVAKKVAAGPTSVEDAQRSKTELATALKTYLKNNGTAKTPDLTAGLQKLLPSSAYEVHITDLPRGLRIVEIDMLLQANDYLVMKVAGGSKVFDLPGLEVFDDARIVNDTAGPMLTLLGHSGGQLPHRPLVRSYALMPDAISDETDKKVPPLKSNGEAKFAGNGPDIVLQFVRPVQVAAAKSASKTAPKTTKDETAYGVLHWKDARYVMDLSTVASQFASQQFATKVAQAPVTTSVTPAPAPAETAASKKTVATATTATGDQKIVVRGLTGQTPGLMASLPPATSSDNHAVTVTTPAKPAKTNSTASSSRTAEVCCTNATIRTRPSRGSAPMGNLPHGARVEVISQENDWCKIKFENSEGYIFAPLLDPNANKQAASVPEVQPTQTSSRRRRTARRNNDSMLVADASKQRRSSSTESRSRSEASTESRSGSRSSRRQRRKAAPVVNDAPPPLVP